MASCTCCTDGLVAVLTLNGEGGQGVQVRDPLIPLEHDTIMTVYDPFGNYSADLRRDLAWPDRSRLLAA